MKLAGLASYKVMWRGARFCGAGALALVLAGCSGGVNPPSVPLFGSFFPAWVICAVGGMIVAGFVRSLFIRLGLDEHLPVPPLVYLCLAISTGIGFWFLWSGLI